MAEIVLGHSARAQALDDLITRVYERVSAALPDNKRLDGQKNLNLCPTRDGGTAGSFNLSDGDRELINLYAWYDKKTLHIHARTEGVLLISKEEANRLEQRYPGYFVEVKIFQEYAQPAPDGQDKE